MNAPAFTLSRELVASLRPTLPTERLPVPELVERLNVAREENAAWMEIARTAPMGSALEAKAADNGAACDDREFILRNAIIAAVDAALQDIGLTFAALQALEL